jgi:sulfur carrier protein ThiS
LKENLLKTTSENTSQIDKKETENEEQNVEQLLEKIEEYKEAEYCVQEINNSIIPKEKKRKNPNDYQKIA